MKTLKLDSDQISLIKKSIHKYSKEMEDEYLRLVNTSITPEQRKEYTQERSLIDGLLSKLDKK
ncbi:MAG: hypothetical protein RSG52_10360 [Terrisporobacter sp.]|uniref:hypothetical protein n=1 Tax=Terrisporobacter sp. TaxID=1965305 RepID=UPI002FC94CC2